MDKKSEKYILLYRYSNMENYISYEEIPSRNVKLGLENFKIFGQKFEFLVVIYVRVRWWSYRWINIGIFLILGISKSYHGKSYQDVFSVIFCRGTKLV